nr:transposon TX1 uncharacterized [Tanacetum cinerariifolium]
KDKQVVRYVVGDVQNAFIKGRYILDEVIIANETMYNLKQTKKKSLIFKVDFEKAYDSINWRFLANIIIRMGFRNKWCNWVKACLKSSSMSILVNSSPSDKFKVKRGVREKNLTLLGKWWWRFRTKGGGLWVKVSKSIYGACGGLGGFFGGVRVVIDIIKRTKSKQNRARNGKRGKVKSQPKANPVKVKVKDGAEAEKLLNRQTQTHLMGREVVEVVTTARLITKVVAAVSKTVSVAAIVQANVLAAPVNATAVVTTAASVKVAVPSTRRRRRVVIRDLEEESSAKTPTETKSKDKGKVIMRYQVMKKRPQTEAQARRNMMVYMKNTAGFTLDYFKGMLLGIVIFAAKVYCSCCQGYNSAAALFMLPSLLFCWWNFITVVK